MCLAQIQNRAYEAPSSAFKAQHIHLRQEPDDGTRLPTAGDATHSESAHTGQDPSGSRPRGPLGGVSKSAVAAPTPAGRTDTGVHAFGAVVTFAPHRPVLPQPSSRANGPPTSRYPSWREGRRLPRRTSTPTATKAARKLYSATSSTTRLCLRRPACRYCHRHALPPTLPRCRRAARARSRGTHDFRWLPDGVAQRWRLQRAHHHAAPGVNRFVDWLWLDVRLGPTGFPCTICHEPSRHPI